MSFADDLRSIGFAFQSSGRGGVRHYALAGNRYLTYYCHVEEDESALVFSWEFALGEFCQDHGLRVGANEVLNVFLYPAEDAPVEPSLAAVVAAIDAADERLNALRLADPDL